ncbi:MAG: SIMPL domain-containing protein [Hyphomicrobiales bacterium]
MFIARVSHARPFPPHIEAASFRSRKGNSSKQPLTGGWRAINLVLSLITFSTFAATPSPVGARELGLSDRFISVTGLGEVSAVPNLAVVTIGVSEQANTAADALASNSEATNAVMKTLKSHNIRDNDIQTSHFSIDQRYSYAEPPGSAPAKITGYEVSNQVTVKLRDATLLATVLDEVVKAGSNRISAIAFGFADGKSLKSKARLAAVEDARHKAELYAKAAGVSLGAVISISEAGGAPFMADNGRSMMVNAAGAPPMARGEKTIRAQISMTWELKNSKIASEQSMLG